MSYMVLEGALAALPGLLNQIDTPMFLLAIDGNREIRFAGLNPAHERRTGVKSAEIAGFRPHEVLPPRMADTVMANYTRCLETEEPLTYEEVLELPSGRIWWKTTLSPIRERGRIVGIVGSAVDITSVRSRLETTMQDAERWHRRATSMQTLADVSMTQMRGPLNNIVNLCRMLRVHLRPPMEEKVQVLDLLVETAVNALNVIDTYENDEEARSGDLRTAEKEVDFGHLCRDLSALADPDRAFSITFPEATFVADADVLQTMLHGVLDQAASIAQSWIGLAVSPDQQKRNAIRIHLRCDLRSDVDPQKIETTWLQAAARARGAEFDVEGRSSEAEPRTTITFLLVLQGRFLSSKNDRARAVNQRLTDHASD